MTWKDSLRFVGTVGLVAGQRVDGALKLTNGVLTDYIDVTVRTTVRVTVAAATALRNRGRAIALLDEVVFDENGAERINARGPVLRYLAEMNAHSPLPSVNIPTNPDGTVAIGVYPISSTTRIFFAWPESANPTETSFAERNASATLRMLFRQVANPVLALMTPGPATVTVDPVTVDVVQGYSGEGNAPLFIPNVRSTITPVNGTLNAYPEYIRSPYKIRAIVYSQEVAQADGSVVEVSDILTRLALRGDRQFPIGPEAVPYADLVAQSPYKYGGEVSSAAHVGLHFVKQGRLARLLDPAADTNMRTEFTGAASATAGQSQIRTTYVELMEVPGVTVPASARPF